MIDLNDVLTLSEASELWEIDSSLLRKYLTKGDFFKEHEFKKSKDIWLITRRAMIRAFGQIGKRSCCNPTLKAMDESEYQEIKFLSLISYKGKTYNYRNKLLLELAYEYLLSNKELKYLKVDDVKFIDNKAILKLEKRTIKISNEEIINDIKNTIEEKELAREGKDEQLMVRSLIESEYLFRPVESLISNSEHISNPNLLIEDCIRQLLE